LQPAVSAAAKHTIPRKIEFLIRESYDWFSKSSLRQDSYKNLYAAINEGKEPLKIVQACQTRWLFVEVAGCKSYRGSMVRIKNPFSSGTE
jgi:hypothetical protein